MLLQSPGNVSGLLLLRKGCLGAFPEIHQKSVSGRVYVSAQLTRKCPFILENTPLGYNHEMNQRSSELSNETKPSAFSEGSVKKKCRSYSETVD